jgi:hypothetical protein
MLKPPYVSDCTPVVRVTALPSNPLAVPATGSGHLALQAPRPNPFDREAVFAFELPRAGHVRLAIVDLAGRTVATLVDAERASGPQTAVWRGLTSTGGTAGAGVYFARLSAAGETRRVRVVRLPG